MTSLDFDQLLDTDRLRAALAEADGRGVCVALLGMSLVLLNFGLD